MKMKGWEPLPEEDREKREKLFELLDRVSADSMFVDQIFPGQSITVPKISGKAPTGEAVFFGGTISSVTVETYSENETISNDDLVYVMDVLFTNFSDHAWRKMEEWSFKCSDCAATIEFKGFTYNFVCGDTDTDYCL